MQHYCSAVDRVQNARLCWCQQHRIFLKNILTRVCWRSWQSSCRDTAGCECPRDLVGAFTLASLVFLICSNHTRSPLCRASIGEMSIQCMRVAPVGLVEIFNARAVRLLLLQKAAIAVTVKMQIVAGVDQTQKLGKFILCAPKTKFGHVLVESPERVQWLPMRQIFMRLLQDLPVLFHTPTRLHQLQMLCIWHEPHDHPL
mmetsp:Transcript_68067/g.118440  ORF Transcript_68067/g.118440 Transcript_68067/m.118440 type:complete len:200 (+) Transcript_68067:47-646(+)